MIHLWHTYPLSEPHGSMFILSKIRCLASFYQLLDLLDLIILKLTLPYLLLKSRLDFYSDSLSVTNKTKVEFLKLPTQFLRHLADPGGVRITLATQSISNHVSFSGVIVYLQVIILYEL